MGNSMGFMSKRYIIGAAKDWFGVDITFNEIEIIKQYYADEPLVGVTEDGKVQRFEFALMRYLEEGRLVEDQHQPAPPMTASEVKVALFTMWKEYGVEMTGVQLDTCYNIYLECGNNMTAGKLVKYVIELLNIDIPNDEDKTED